MVYDMESVRPPEGTTRSNQTSVEFNVSCKAHSQSPSGLTLRLRSVELLDYVLAESVTGKSQPVITQHLTASMRRLHHTLLSAVYLEKAECEGTCWHPLARVAW